MNGFGRLTVVTFPEVPAQSEFAQVWI